MSELPDDSTSFPQLRFPAESCANIIKMILLHLPLYSLRERTLEQMYTSRRNTMCTITQTLNIIRGNSWSAEQIASVAGLDVTVFAQG